MSTPRLTASGRPRAGARLPNGSPPDREAPRAPNPVTMGQVRGTFAWIWVLAAALTALALGGCGDSADDPVDPKFPFTFTQPEGFREASDVNIDTQVGAEAVYSSAIGLATEDIIIFETYDLRQSVTESNLDEAEAELDPLMRQLDRDAEGMSGTTAGLPSITYDEVGITTVPNGVSRLTFLFDGEREYLINCQASESPDEVDAACDEVLTSLTPAD